MKQIFKKIVEQKAWLINRLWTGTPDSQQSIDYNLSQNDKNNMKRKQAGGQKFAGKPTYKIVYFRPCNTITELSETTANRSSTRNWIMLAILSLRTAHSHQQVGLTLRSMTRERDWYIICLKAARPTKYKRYGPVIMHLGKFFIPGSKTDFTIHNSLPLDPHQTGRSL
jgi:hypothetical protein